MSESKNPKNFAQPQIFYEVKNLMDAIISDIKKISFSDNDIKKLLDSSIADVMDYDVLNTVEDFSKPIIFLLQKNNRGVGHWVCLLFHDAIKRIEFFDSYGNSFKENLLISNEPNYLYHIIENKINQGYTYHENDIQLQKLNAETNTCALHCVLRVLMKNLNNEEYAKMLLEYSKKHKQNVDATVVSLLFGMLLKFTLTP